MSYREFSPCPALRAHVACYWISTPTHDAPAHRVLPDGAMDILLRLTPAATATAVVGAMTTAHVVSHRAGDAFLGVRFRPGEAFALLPLSCREALDIEVDLAVLWGALARELGERVQEASSWPARLAQLEGMLLRRLRDARPADARLRAAVRALEAGPQVTVAAVARQVGLSERQLERGFAERVGVGPKMLARIVRLQRWLARTETPARPGWAGLALETGYADQAHMIREIRALSGLTPVRLLQERGMSDSFNPGPGAASMLRSP